MVENSHHPVQKNRRDLQTGRAKEVTTPSGSVENTPSEMEANGLRGRKDGINVKVMEKERGSLDILWRMS